MHTPAHHIEKVHGMVYGTAVNNQNAFIYLEGGEFQRRTRMFVKAPEQEVERMSSTAKETMQMHCSPRVSSPRILIQIYRYIFYIVFITLQSHKLL